MDEQRVEAESSPTAARYLVDRLAEHDSLARVYQAARFEFIDAIRLQFERDLGADWHDPDSLEWRDLRAEVAAVLQVHERTAQSLLELARQLVHVFPSTFARLRQAEFSERHARVLVEHSHGLAAELVSEYEARLLEFVDLPVPRFDRMARKIRADLQPEELIERHKEALVERRTAVEPAGDGMAWYGAYMSAEYVIGAAAAVTGLAKGLMVEGETRTLQQIEADVFRDLLIDAGGVTAPVVEGEPVQSTPAARRGINPQVATTVPVLTALGRSDEPGQLERYGPIDADTARRIAGEAPGWIRILTDPEDGAITSFGRTTYKVPKQLRRYLAARDEVCRFVGCTRSVEHCDVDHTKPWAEDGETVAANLAHLCKGHHMVKGRKRWRVTASPGGTLTWTSPTGRTYTTKPARTFAPPGRTIPGAPPLVMRAWLPDDESTAPF
ncbi:HNH endonuclease signature motif containing protein [Herbiconiux sp. L3-i23]|uniref:HNH endonuclease n=1 Tax=Herbiconiux sp. L3-i23 TaxID=2905871 RepID=UPI002074130A|nr:HNH endonuclease signature motif containing protein [Herbiconiux sp. L3-i23]